MLGIESLKTGHGGKGVLPFVLLCHHVVVLWVPLEGSMLTLHPLHQGIRLPGKMWRASPAIKGILSWAVPVQARRRFESGLSQILS